MNNIFKIDYNKLFPNGKLQERLINIKHHENGESVIKSPLHISGEISLKFSSSFGSIYDSEPNTLMTIISGATDSGITGQFQAQGAQIWKSTEPLDINLDVELMMNDNGKNDVVKPALELAKLCLPSTSEKTRIGKKLKCLIPPGPNIQSIINSAVGTNFEEKGLYDIQIGWLNLKECLIKEATPTFSSVVDEDGFPISATISLSITTLMIPTVQSVNDIIDSLSENVVDSTLIDKLIKLST